MLKKREMLLRVTITLGHEGCDCLLGESKACLDTEIQTWFGCVETYSSTDAYYSQAAALL